MWKAMQVVDESNKPIDSPNGKCWKQSNKRKLSRKTRDSAPLGTLEAFGNILSTVIEQQAQWDGDIKIDAQNLGLDGSAKANSSFNISKTLDKAAARCLWWGSNNKVHQVIQQVGTHPELKGVLRASGGGLTRHGGRVFWSLWGRWARDVSWSDHSEKEKVEGD
jgi:hypothetical protein